MRIAFFLAVWKRPEITELCFMGLQRLMKHYPNSFAFAVISEKSMIPLCQKYDIEYCEHENLPLGRKKNYGMNQILKKKFDYLIELGSDDLIFNDVFNQGGVFIGMAQSCRKGHLLSQRISCFL